MRKTAVFTAQVARGGVAPQQATVAAGNCARAPYTRRGEPVVMPTRGMQMQLCAENVHARWGGR